MSEYWYRYDDILSGSEDYRYILIMCRSFLVAKHTPKGVRLSGFHGPWVSNTARKRLAYPTTEEAWESFRHRKRRQVKIYKARLTRSEEALELSKAPCPGLVTLRTYRRDLFSA